MSGLKRIKREDVPGAPPWFDRFLDQYNAMVDFLVGAFDGGISLVGNVRGDMRELEIRTESDYTSGEFTAVRFKTKLSSVMGVTAVQVIDLDDQDTVLSGSFSVEYRARNGEVEIRWVDGLAPSSRYRIRFHVF